MSVEDVAARIRRVCGRDFAATALELAEILWLANLGKNPRANPEPLASEKAAAPASAPSAARPNQENHPARPAPLPDLRETAPATTTAGPAAVGFAPQTAPADAVGANTQTVPLAPAPLRGKSLHWRRALHRIAAPTAIPGVGELDLSATVTASARAGRTWPVFRPRMRCATQLVVAFDAAGQMEPFRPQVVRLVKLARASARFRRVDVVELDVANDARVDVRTLVGREGKPGVNTRMQDVVDGSALVLVVSDGLGPAFTSGALGRALVALPRQTQAAWVHPWPSGFRQLTAASRLVIGQPRPLPGPPEAGEQRETVVALAAWEPVCVPIVELSAHHEGLLGLERFTLGRGRLPLGLRIPLHPPRQRARATTAATTTAVERVMRIAARAGPRAIDVLAIAAAFPGLTNLARLQALAMLMPDRCEPIHFALALAAGVLKRIHRVDGHVFFGFVDEIGEDSHSAIGEMRKALLASLPRKQLADVLDGVSRGHGVDASFGERLQLPLEVHGQGFELDPRFMSVALFRGIAEHATRPDVAAPAATAQPTRNEPLRVIADGLGREGNWYAMIERQRTGPFTVAEIEHQIGNGSLTVDVELQHGDGDWRPAGDLFATTFANRFARTHLHLAEQQAEADGVVDDRFRSLFRAYSKMRADCCQDFMHLSYEPFYKKISDIEDRLRVKYGRPEIVFSVVKENDKAALFASAPRPPASQKPAFEVDSRPDPAAADDDISAAMRDEVVIATPAAVAPAVAVAPASSLAAHGEGTAHEVERLLAEAETYVKSGLLKTASSKLKRVLLLQPEHLSALEHLKNAQLALGERLAAAATLLDLIRIGRAANHPKLSVWVQELSNLDGTLAQPPSPSIDWGKVGHASRAEGGKASLVKQEVTDHVVIVAGGNRVKAISPVKPASTSTGPNRASARTARRLLDADDVQRFHDGWRASGDVERSGFAAEALALLRMAPAPRPQTLVVPKRELGGAEIQAWLLDPAEQTCPLYSLAMIAGDALAGVFEEEGLLDRSVIPTRRPHGELWVDVSRMFGTGRVRVIADSVRRPRAVWVGGKRGVLVDSTRVDAFGAGSRKARFHYGCAALGLLAHHFFLREADARAVVDIIFGAVSPDHRGSAQAFAFAGNRTATAALVKKALEKRTQADVIATHADSVSPIAFAAFFAARQRSEWNAGLLACGSLQVAVEALAETQPVATRGAPLDADALNDLIRFALSDNHFKARAALQST